MPSLIRHHSLPVTLRTSTPPSWFGHFGRLNDQLTNPLRVLNINKMAEPAEAIGWHGYFGWFGHFGRLNDRLINRNDRLINQLRVLMVKYVYNHHNILS